MKNIETIQAEINETINLMESQVKEKGKAHGNTVKKLRKLKTCKMYLQSKPSEGFVLSERDRLSKQLESLFKRYPQPDREKVTKKQANDALRQFEKELGIPLIRTQLSTVRFILS